jgi:hypothetical protein
VIRLPEPEIIVGIPRPGCAPGTHVLAEAFEEELEPLPGARVLARFADGAPAIVENSYGKGKAILIGSFLALAYARQHQEATEQLLLALLREAGVAPEVTVSGENTSQVEVRRLEGRDIQFLFAFNHSDRAADARITVRVPWKVGEARSLEDDKQVAFTPSDEGLVFTRRLPAGGIWVVRYSRK